MVVKRTRILCNCQSVCLVVCLSLCVYVCVPVCVRVLSISGAVWLSGLVRHMVRFSMPAAFFHSLQLNEKGKQPAQRHALREIYPVSKLNREIYNNRASTSQSSAAKSVDRLQSSTNT